MAASPNATHVACVTNQRERWARFRFTVIGALLASPPQSGALYTELVALSAKPWQHPLTGAIVRFGVSTLERWYYKARRVEDPVAALKNKSRANQGSFPSLKSEVISLLVLQYREHPGWTVQLHVDNMRAHFSGTVLVLPSYQTVNRYFRHQGMFRKKTPKRNTAGALAARNHLEQCEVRSYEVEYVLALWHLDFHHGSLKVLIPDGSWVVPMLLCILDDRSRLVCHIQWYLDETAQSLIHGLSQALMKRGLPRALMTDNGAAMLAEETTAGLARLGILHQTTLPYSPYQNGKQESLWGQVEGRLLAMLDGESNLTLDKLNLYTQAWVEQEYQRKTHSETNTTPLARHLDDKSVGRLCPEQDALQRAFCIEVKRKQRRSDGTVSLDGVRFEIPARYRHLEYVHLRYARWNLSQVELVDAVTGQHLCAILPLDKSANADGQRKALSPLVDLSPLPPSGLPPLMQKLLADYAACGIAPAYLPMDNAMGNHTTNTHHPAVITPIQEAQ